jgi:hypothetical protein
MVFVVTEQERLGWGESADRIIRYVSMDLNEAKKAFLRFVQEGVDDDVEHTLHDFPLDAAIDETENNNYLYCIYPCPSEERESRIRQVRESIDGNK